MSENNVAANWRAEGPDRIETWLDAHPPAVFPAERPIGELQTELERKRLTDWTSQGLDGRAIAHQIVCGRHVHRGAPSRCSLTVAERIEMELLHDVVRAGIKWEPKERAAAVLAARDAVWADWRTVILLEFWRAFGVTPLQLLELINSEIAFAAWQTLQRLHERFRETRVDRAA